MMINYEIVNIVAGAAFIISLVLSGKFNVLKVILSVMTMVCIVVPPSSPIYFIVLSSISLLQAWYLIGKGRNNSSYRYLLYSFLFIFMNIPIISGHSRLILICLFLFKALLASYKDEISDTFMFILNTALIAGVILNIQTSQPASVTAAILFFMIIIGSLRYILDASVKTPMYVLPLFTIATILSGGLVMTLSILYTFLAAIIYINNREKVGLSFLCLFAIPFIDSSIMQLAIKDVVAGLSFIEQDYALWSVIAIGTIAIFKFYEQHLLSALKSIKLRHVIEALAAVAIAIGAGLSKYELSKPIPLFCIIPLIVIEARYLHLVNRIPLIPILNFNKLSTFPRTAMSAIRRYYSMIIVCTIKRIRSSLSSSAWFIETKIIKNIGVEEFIAIICAITVLLIFFLGDK